jgi:hypothetical protein
VFHQLIDSSKSETLAKWTTIITVLMSLKTTF